MKRVVEYLFITLGFVAPTIELSLGICKNVFFDPLPTIIHVFVFYLMPCSLLIARYNLSKSYSDKRNRIVITCLSYAFVSSIAYSCWFLPISWISLLAIIALGIGILGLTPFFVLTAVGFVYSSWLSWAPQDKRQSGKLLVFKSLLFVIPLLIVLWWNPIVILIGESLLKSEDVSSKYTGLAVLDNLASRDEVQWRCFNQNTRFLWGEMYDAKVLRNAYYYMYGSRPGIAKKGEGFLGATEWDFDRDQGSSAIGRRQEGLVIAESAIDGVVNTDKRYGYYEWTLVFDNTTLVQKEARAAIQLPPYSVVSKASLWVDGEEREAAYGTTAHVKSVYQSIVRRRKDPLLVTMIGADQVMIQCFPVPVEGSMKIRIGVTCPLLENNRLNVPRFIESNFEISNDLEHNVWVEAESPIQAVVAGELIKDQQTQIAIPHEKLAALNTYFQIQVENSLVDSSSNWVLTPINSEDTQNDQKPVLLIDGRKDVLSLLADAEIDEDIFSTTVIAQPFGFSVRGETEELSQFLNSQDVYGGVNPSPALVEAVRLAGSYGVPVIWVHGSLPSSIRRELAFEQIMRRGVNPVHIHTLAVSGDLNSLVSDLASMRYFTPHAPTGDIKEDLSLIVSRIHRGYRAKDNTIALGGRAISGMAFELNESAEVTHPYRLYMYSRIMGEWYNTGEASEELIKQAIGTRIVTPVTGAVVLENQDQYERADLDPSVGAENIPKIPEPEFYILLGISLLVGSIYYFRNRKRQCNLSQ